MTLTPDKDLRIEPAAPADRRVFRAGLLASVAFHVAVAAALITDVEGFQAAGDVDAVEVEIVQLPPSVTPEPVEAPAVEEPDPEVPEPEVPEPEPAEPEEQAEEQADPPPLEPAAPETDPEPEDIASLPVLQEVQEFGEEDVLPDGASEEEPANEPVDAEDVADTDTPEEPSDASATDDPGLEDGAGEDEVADGDAEGEPETDPETVLDQQLDDLVEESLEQLESETETETFEDGSSGETETADAENADSAEDISPEETVPDSEEAGTDAAVDLGEEGELSADSFGVVGPIATAATPAPKPVRRSQATAANANPSAGSGSALPQARELFTGGVLQDSRLVTAMSGMPPGQRLNLLCTTELRAQLNASNPPYFPDIMPSLRPRRGTVLDPGGWVAFRAYGLWYNVAFRCEVDPGVRRVERFSFRVGGPIPRAEWGARGLPVN
ncbi:DUF930 domain-containing protein [Roseibium denhamense]|uniref:DUF930 domain-containing protein n=1 Tax=Roseibium denhamense TaxID=76305 RepID=A0ABY1NDM3_9HYPH|nr:DUF930 domain-containing protein [Roseibium denhamense]MTI04297.1 DUF930 domain-containing protein [Roseibium denhamense]SMP07203.1 protein of unknown function [Roseibium denhamense]